MHLLVFPSGPYQTNCYLVADPDKKACIIDPSPGSAKNVLAAVEKNGFLPEKILLTHSHWDHIADVAKLKEALAIPVLVHEQDAENLRAPGSDGLPYPVEILPVEPDFFLKDGDKISVGSYTFEVLHTPGHTKGGVVFFEPRLCILFTGDTLFKGTIGNLSFPNSVPKQMWNSLKKILSLPPDTTLFPGHGEKTTLRNELRWLERAQELYSI